MASPDEGLLLQSAELLARLREKRPRVHLIISPLAAPRAADALAALGAEPALSEGRQELDAFLQSSQALVVNLGMMDERRERAAREAADRACALRLPWLLDPVKVHQSQRRLALARELLEQAPAVVKPNREELFALGAREPEEFARRHRVVVACTGSIDVLCGPERALRFPGASPYLAAVTAGGCTLGAVMAAFLAVEADPFKAALAGLAVYREAASWAEERASGPGTFAALFLDALHSLEPAALSQRGRA